MENIMFERPSDMKAGQFRDGARWHGHNDNTSPGKRNSRDDPGTCGHLRVEADGKVAEFIVPGDEESELMVLISEIAAAADAEEAIAVARRRRRYLVAGSVALGISMLVLMMLIELAPNFDLQAEGSD
ncbi:hypothetical protein [Neorhizobium sp. DT-125]|uniref:hypothetical protein n=1 Tax=Neorhizobium sp. DT-125 TaxID=3396163 RepID=UPI003F1C3C58